MLDRADVVIVTPDYLSSTPRVVREATALSDAGLKVAVVHGAGPLEQLREADRRLLLSRPFVACPISRSPRGTEGLFHALSGLRHRVAKRLAPLVGESAPGRVLHSWASSRIGPELARAAARIQAPLYIGHYPGGLVAAASAARRRGGRLGYDAEDLHAGETHTEQGRHAARAARIEARLLPICSSVTASSLDIAEELVMRYRIPAPLVVHNCPDRVERAHLGQRRDPTPRTSFGWFSQTIGLDRGLQTAIRALGLVGAPTELHLRGSCAPEVRDVLRRLVVEHAPACRLWLHPPAHPDDLLCSVAEQDVGLALEPGGTLANRLAASNKLFAYLAAGMAVVATSTPGQVRVLAASPGAGRVCRPEDAADLARAIRELLAPGALGEARAAARHAAATRWRYEAEARDHVEAVLQLVGRACGSSSRDRP